MYTVAPTAECVCVGGGGGGGEVYTVWVGLSLLQEEPLKEVGSQHAGCGLVLSSLFRGSQNWEGCRDLPTSDITCCTYGWWVRKEGQTVRKSLLYVRMYIRTSLCHFSCEKMRWERAAN